MFMMAKYSIHDNISNSLFMKNSDSSGKKTSYMTVHLINLDRTTKIINEIKSCTSKKQSSNSENKFRYIKEILVNKLLRCILLHVLILTYILNQDKNTTRKSVLVSTYKLLEKNVPLLTEWVSEKKYRVVAEMFSNEEETEDEVTGAIPNGNVHEMVNGLVNGLVNGEHSHEEDEEEEEELESFSDSNSDLDSTEEILRQIEKNEKLQFPRDVVTICKEYRSLVKELKVGIFFSEQELDAFLNTMKEKIKIVETYAPILLNKEEEEDMLKIKILKYYTEQLKKTSKINKLRDDIIHYIVSLGFFKAVWKAESEEEKSKKTEHSKYYSERMKNYDEEVYNAIRTRLQKLENQLKSNSSYNAENIFEQEKKTFTDALYSCRKYMDVLDKIRRFGTLDRKRYKVELYNMEEELFTKIPEFF